MTHSSLFPRGLTLALFLLPLIPAHAQVTSQPLPGSTHQNPASATALTVVPQDFARLRLEPGFLLALNVLDDSDLSGSFRIDEDGNLMLPVIGVLHVAGDTASEASLRIRQRLLADQVLKDPEVNLAVIEYVAPQVTIVGEVTTPGKYPLFAPRSLVDVLALAGGTTNAAGDEVEIVRGLPSSASLLVHYSNLTDPKNVQQALVDPGDTVQVKRAGIVYVLGAVNRPGGYVMQEQGTISVLEALALANGTALVAKTGDVHVLSKDDNGAITDTRLSYKQITAGKAPDPQLHARDILYVPVDKLKAIVGNGSAIFSSAASASIYSVLQH